MILQLNPTIPVHTSKGDGYAIALIDYGQEFHILWLVALNDGGAIWTLPNPEVRLQVNETMGRKAARQSA